MTTTETDTTSDNRFDLIELDFDRAPAAPASKPATKLQDVATLYKGAFKSHATLDAAFAAVPELAGTVEKVPLYTPDGLKVPHAYGTIRTLPDGTRQALGTVGERYRVVQDSRALEVLRPLAERGQLRNFTSGVWQAQSWLYGESGRFAADIVPGDTIEARALVGNSHDGSIAWSFGFPGNRVVCQNTFHFALSSRLSKLLKVRHTAGANEIVSQVAAAVEAFGTEFVESADKFRYLASVKCSDEQLREYTDYVFRPSKWADTSDEDQEIENEGRVYARVLENYQAGAGSEYARGTWWGALNAVTEYTTHQRGRDSATPEHRFSDLHWGAGARLARRALDGAMEFAR
jgi:phage/plasmid-like protein (TIGR03299 family)